MTTNETEIAPGIETLFLEADGVFPNNPLPVVIYRQAIALAEDDPAASIEERYHDQGWDGVWRNGIETEHHYHGTAHEVLGIALGSVRVQLGGPNGSTIELAAGDIAVLPAGTSHKNLEQSSDLIVVGGYPSGQRPDMLYGAAREQGASVAAIGSVALPQTDPVLGEHGPLIALWGASGSE